MDWALLIPMLALAIPLAAVVSHGMQKVARSRVEEARARAESVGTGGSNRIEALEADVEQLRQELGEVHERLDFTERMLTQNRERPRLPDAGDSSPENAARD